MTAAADALLHLGFAAAMLIAYAAWERRTERRPALQLGAAALGWFAAGAAYGAALVGATVGAMALVGGYRIVGVRAPAGLGEDLCSWIAIAVGQEIVFRGLILRVLQRRLGWSLASVASGGLYGLIHLINPHAGGWAVVALAVESVGAYALVYRLSRSLWSVIGVHLAWNLVEASVLGAPDSGQLYAGIVIPQITGPAWLTGGAFGPEASWPGVLVCTAAAVLLCAATRWRAGQGALPG